MRTTIRSDSTRVPPVTAERSPPASRMTGADSPVIADSSMLAIPSTTSPSLGITSPATTTTSSPRSSWVPGTSSSEPSGRRRFAIVSERVLRSVSACALPRPSATASAKFANSTVNQRNPATSAANTFWFDARRSEVGEEQDRREHAADLDDEHHRVLQQVTRVELDEAVDRRAAQDRAVQQRRAGPDAVRLGLAGRTDRRGRWSSRSLLDAELLDDGTERECREEREPGDDDGDAEQQPANSGVFVGNVPGRRRDLVLAGERAGDAPASG